MTTYSQVDRPLVPGVEVGVELRPAMPTDDGELLLLVPIVICVTLLVFILVTSPLHPAPRHVVAGVRRCPTTVTC